MDIAERTVIDALETCEVDHNKAFVKEALHGALNSLVMSILEDEFGIRESFEFAVVQIATIQVVMPKIATTVVTDSVVLAPIVQFAVDVVK